MIRIEMIFDILKGLKTKYTSDNDTYEELYRSYRNLVYQLLSILEYCF